MKDDGFKKLARDKTHSCWSRFIVGAEMMRVPTSPFQNARYQAQYSNMRVIKCLV